MISQHQFNAVLKELNTSFAALAERVEKLEAEVKEAKSASKKGLKTK
jgi:uncharacterized small protein (DUF1192 family)